MGSILHFITDLIHIQQISLHELRVDDGSEDTLYKQIVTVKSIGTHFIPDFSEDHPDKCSTDVESSVDQDAFFGSL